MITIGVLRHIRGIKENLICWMESLYMNEKWGKRFVFTMMRFNNFLIQKLSKYQLLGIIFIR